MDALRPVLGGALALISIALCIALVSGRASWRRWAVLSLAGLSLLVPLSQPRDYLLVRGLFALWTILIVLRAIDLASERRTSPLGLRLPLMFVVFDIRAARRCAPELLPRAFAFGVFMGLLAALGLASVMLWVPSVDAPWRYPLRWICGTVFVYASADAAGQLVTAGYRGMGLQIPPQHNHPILSRSVGEFWSKRWNINVHSWLMRHVFRPFAARRHPVSGLVAAFCVSALLHFWLIWAALGLSWGLAMGAFFLVQGGLVIAERVIRLDRIRPGFQRGWTIAWMLLTAPLFVEPFLRLVHTPL